MADLGLSWNICFFVTAVVFILLVDYGMDVFPILYNFSIPLIFGIVLICGPVFIVMEYLNRSTIPMVGGFYGSWPDGYWDWPNTFKIVAAYLLAFWIGMKVYLYIKKKKRIVKQSS